MAAQAAVVSAVQRQFSALLVFCNNLEDPKGKAHGFKDVFTSVDVGRPAAMSSRLLSSSLCSFFLFRCRSVTTASVPFALYFGGLVELDPGLNFQTHICFGFVSPSCLCVTSCTIFKLN